jgi:hypothetical protein
MFPYFGGPDSLNYFNYASVLLPKTLYLVCSLSTIILWRLEYKAVVSI